MLKKFPLKKMKKIALSWVLYHGRRRLFNQILAKLAGFPFDIPQAHVAQ